ncbi:hypothetical protein [Microcella frigidaquae]|uniref:Uncharacterized protein n=1 Tax=Microcella frigidaquae TaxID=424758 RepID=A0A840XIL3_9MICO|nr:hypothetical protein [Microcella frigidaquae]MBB5618322.1 hypothetical protein [Microcella frigidaquae]MCA1943243.1 hypothetical protein [Microcella sp.]NHN44773.1 hypothetical protein [Microcella frigidaquae]
MRFWPASAPVVGTRPPELPRDLRHQIDEGYLVAVAALRLAVKNGVIRRILGDGVDWNEEEALALAREAIETLISEQRAGAVRLSEESVRAAPTARETRRASSKRDRAKVRRKREEADRLAARSRTLRGVVEKLEAARADEDFLHELAMRAREETLGELMQARLIPRAPVIEQTEEERRESIAGVLADLQRLMDERTGY